MTPTVFLEGAPNFRDLGGLTSSDGNRVRCGLIYRSQSLAALTDDDLSVIRQLGIRVVCDLRSGGERRHAPSRWSPELPGDLLLLESGSDVRALNRQRLQSLLDDSDGQRAQTMMMTVYRRMPYELAHGVALVIRRLLQPEGVPAIVHCTAGKDRTGFVCALLLLALGVPQDEVYRDYLLTTQRLHRPQIADSLSAFLQARLGRPPSEAALEQLLAAKAEYLDEALHSILDRYGSVDGYLDSLGAGARSRERLRELLLE